MSDEKKAKWITAPQYKILSKYDKIWADLLKRGEHYRMNISPVRNIESHTHCIVGVLHLYDPFYENCKDCVHYAHELNEKYKSDHRGINGGAKLFRTLLGGFLTHFESQHPKAVLKAINANKKLQYYSGANKK